MWHSGSKCQRIKALLKANRKRLKADLVSGVEKLSPVFLVSKLGKFPLFGSFFDFSPLDFPNLDDFQNLADFWPFDFSYFLAYSTPSPSNLSTSLLLLFLFKASLLSLFLLEADLLQLFLLEAGLFVVFNIEISGIAILLKSWMNRR